MNLKNKLVLVLALTCGVWGCSSSDKKGGPKDAVTDEDGGDEDGAASPALKAKGDPLMVDKFLLTEVPWREDDSAGKPLSGGSTIADLFARRQYEKAEVKVRRILKSDPYQPQAIVILIQSLLMQRKFALAQIYANLNQKKLNNNADFLNARGVTAYVVYRGSGQGIKLASEAFRSALKVDENHLASRVNFANILLLTSREKDAREAFVKLKQDCKQCYVATYGLATASMRLSRFGEAVDNWNLVIKRNPKDYGARFYLSQTYLYGLKNRAKAKQTLDVLLNVLPKDETEWLAKARDLQQVLGGAKLKKSEDDA